MREIKFRALVEYDDKRVWEHYSTFDQPTWLERKIIVKDLQYTGLKDKNGKEIFEGDIINFNNPDVGGRDIGEIVYRDINGAYMCHSKKEDDHYFLFDFNTDEKLEIIGNIYSNPELLEVI